MIVFWRSWLERDLSLTLLPLPKLYGVKIYNYVNMSKAKFLEKKMGKLENKLRDVKEKEETGAVRSIIERNPRIKKVK